MLCEPRLGLGAPELAELLALSSATGVRRPFLKEETPRVTDRSSSVSGVAERYASALFDLARDANEIPAVEGKLITLSQALDESAELRRLVESPVFSAEEQVRAIEAVAKHLGIDGITVSFLGLVARNRRLFALRGMIRAFRDMAARHRGEVTAEVTSAHTLGDEQIAALKGALRDKVGKDVTLQVRVNPAILGGLIVKVGSRMIDTSLRTRLMTVRTQLKEVG